MAKDDDILKDARERYAESEDGCSEIKAAFEEDYRFGRLSEQWPDTAQQDRKDAGRPVLTINRMPSFLRQVINDGRQNRPSIKVRPVDSGADVQTAKVMSGLIRHIEAISDADVAYDTALDTACSGGFGFVGVDVEYACDDTFDLDLKIRPIPNPLCISWDPSTTAADSSDWKFAFETEMMPKEEFEKLHPEAASEASDFNGDSGVQEWFETDTVRVAKYYLREETERKILLLSDGMVVDAERAADPEFQALMQGAGATVKQERTVRSYKVTVRKISGADILETTTWAGSTIPIIPLWGDTLNLKGKRYFHSLIHDAKDAQRIHNYSRSTATEMTSLSPKVPFIGEAGAFDTDNEKWTSINRKNWPYVEYAKGKQMPQRQPFTGVPEGAMAEAAASLEDMKSIIGIHDASLGIAGNEISGKAIRYRQHEGDVSTFHFIDNQHRMIRGVGRVLLEMIPQVYSGTRVLRIIGDDGKPAQIAVAPTPPGPTGPEPAPAPALPAGFDRTFDLTQGKYDLAVEAGPSYTTRREEAADMITEFIRAAPATASVLGPMLAKMSDWPESDKVTELLTTMMPPAAKAIMTGQPLPQPGPSPEQLAKQQEFQAEMAMEQQKAQHQFQLGEQNAKNKAQIEQIQAQADIQVMREKAAAEIQIMRERATVEAELKRQEAQLAAELKMVGVPQTVGPAITPATITQ